MFPFQHLFKSPLYYLALVCRVDDQLLSEDRRKVSGAVSLLLPVQGDQTDGEGWGEGEQQGKEVEHLTQQRFYEN